MGVCSGPARHGYLADRRGIGLVLNERSDSRQWRERFAQQPGWRVAFVYSTAAEALAEIRRCPPALLLVDLDLPDGSGFDLLREVGRFWPACVAVAFSSDARLPLELSWPDSTAGTIDDPPLPPLAWPPSAPMPLSFAAETEGAARAPAPSLLRA